MNATQNKKAKTSVARFRKGDRVCVGASAMFPDCWGRTCTVRRVFWAPAGGGQSAGWVCEVDIPLGPGRFRAFWERLLVPADNAGLKD